MCYFNATPKTRAIAAAPPPALLSTPIWSDQRSLGVLKIGVNWKSEHEILQKLKANHLEIPIYAIGGIIIDDIDKLIEIGIYGVAISGVITKSSEKGKLITQLNEKLYANVII